MSDDHDLNLMSRRELLSLMGATLAFGASACVNPPNETIVPYVRAPEGVTPGVPLYFASAHCLGGLARGILIKTHMGRPTKIEGNPDHPQSLGATDIFAQASLLELYDPERAQAITEKAAIRTSASLTSALTQVIAEQKTKQGAGLRILTETVTSPSLAAELEKIRAELPRAVHHQWDSRGRHHTHAGFRLAFGVSGETHYRAEQARVLLLIDADFLNDFPGGLRHAREVTAQRKVSSSTAPMNRIYAIEPTPTPSGTLADHRLPSPAGRIEILVRALASRLGAPGGATLDLEARESKFIEAVAEDLEKSPGASIVVAGEAQPPIVHAWVHGINHLLKNIGRTVIHTAPVIAEPIDQVASLRDLALDLENSSVEALLILGGNPAYTAPADLDFAAKIGRAKFSLHVAPYFDETSAATGWHIPEAHALESWSDARAIDGTISLLQPAIAPLYSGRTIHEILALAFGRAERTSYDLLRAHWKNGGGDDAGWKSALHDGFVRGSRAPAIEVALDPEIFDPGVHPLSPSARASGLELTIRPDPTIDDGRYANNAWLQELPKPITKLTWDNAALISPALAAREKLETGDLVVLTQRNRRVEAPVLVLPGQAENTVTVHLGYGRQGGGKVGLKNGFDAGRLRFSDALSIGPGLTLAKIGRRTELAITQGHFSMEGRNLARTTTLAALASEETKKHGGHPRLSLYPERPSKDHAWAMSIDLSACNGCSACIVACQSENNIAVVGKSEVIRNREMHWLRVDNYFEGEEIRNQPIPCMHCEEAPCEPVCPVGATTHSDEGLNEMTYNRCVGTRYCANNCPYRVRRFNFYLYSDYQTPSLKGMRNPEVTVRSRGVMEKCTFCVQRINRARIDSERTGQAIADGEVTPACAQVCPTQAIVFGDLLDKKSRVVAEKNSTRSYTLLEELGTKPRTTYLARVRNPNPDLERG